MQYFSRNTSGTYAHKAHHMVSQNAHHISPEMAYYTQPRVPVPRRSLSDFGTFRKLGSRKRSTTKGSGRSFKDLNPQSFMMGAALFLLSCILLILLYQSTPNDNFATWGPMNSGSQHFQRSSDLDYHLAIPHRREMNSPYDVQPRHHDMDAAFDDQAFPMSYEPKRRRLVLPSTDPIGEDMVPARFVIILRIGRTGSTWLGNLLQSSVKFSCFESNLDKRYDNVKDIQRAVDSCMFCHEGLICNDDKRRGISLNPLTTPDIEVLVSHLQKQLPSAETLWVIHSRTNHFRRALSHIRYVWVQKNGHCNDADISGCPSVLKNLPSLQILPKLMENTMTQSKIETNQLKEFGRRLKRHSRVLETTYEDMLMDQGVPRALLSEIGIFDYEIRAKNVPNVKTSDDNVESLVSNFDSLCKYLRSTTHSTAECL